MKTVATAEIGLLYRKEMVETGHNWAWSIDAFGPPLTYGDFEPELFAHEAGISTSRHMAQLDIAEKILEIEKRYIKRRVENYRNVLLARHAKTTRKGVKETWQRTK